MFEQFDVPRCGLALENTLQLLSCGRHMGIMIDVGESVTHILPIEGCK